MKNLTKEQIERINEFYFGEVYCDDEEEESIEDKIEAIWQYLDCAGVEIKTEKDLFRYLGI